MVPLSMDQPETKENIGFIGAGTMGHGMCSCLLKAGFPLTVIANRNRAPIDDLIEAIAQSPTGGHKLQSVNCVYRHRWDKATNSKHEHDVYYVYHSARSPVLIVNIFKRGEKDVLSKVVACRADDALAR